MLFWHHHFDTSFVTLDSWRTSLKPVVPGGEEAAMDSPVLKPMEEGTEVLDQAVKIGKGRIFFWRGIGDRQFFNSLLQVFFWGGTTNHVWKVCVFFVVVGFTRLFSGRPSLTSSMAAITTSVVFYAARRVKVQSSRWFAPFVSWLLKGSGLGNRFPGLQGFGGVGLVAWDWWILVPTEWRYKAYFTWDFFGTTDPLWMMQLEKFPHFCFDGQRCFFLHFCGCLCWKMPDSAVFEGPETGPLTYCFVGASKLLWPENIGHKPINADVNWVWGCSRCLKILDTWFPKPYFFPFNPNQISATYFRDGQNI